MPLSVGAQSSTAAQRGREAQLIWPTPRCVQHVFASRVTDQACRFGDKLHCRLTCAYASLTGMVRSSVILMMCRRLPCKECRRAKCSWTRSIANRAHGPRLARGHPLLRELQQRILVSLR